MEVKLQVFTKRLATYTASMAMATPQFGPNSHWDLYEPAH